MNDSILHDAVAKRDAALAEARRWDEFIRMYSELVGASPNTLSGRAPRAISLPTGAGALSTTAAAAIEIISELGRPIPTPELRTALERRGVEVGGKDPNATLSARLSRAPDIVNIRQRGWWIKGKPGDDNPKFASSPGLFQPTSTPVEPGGEVAHDDIDDILG